MLGNSYRKDFEAWCKYKKSLEDNDIRLPFLQEREIWWVSIGVNVGYEEDGKGDSFNRPVLIIKRFNRNLFLGVPLTTKLNRKPYRMKINVKGRICSILISQIKVVSSKRTQNKLMKLPKKEFEYIVNRIFSSISPL